MDERALTYDAVQDDPHLWMAYNMGRNDAHIERMREEYRAPVQAPCEWRDGFPACEREPNAEWRFCPYCGKPIRRAPHG